MHPDSVPQYSAFRRPNKEPKNTKALPFKLVKRTARF